MTDERALAAIRERVGRGEYVISCTHSEKLRERKISAHDVEAAICDGAIIEDYPDDREDPAASFSAAVVNGLFISYVVSSETSAS